MEIYEWKQEKLLQHELELPIRVAFSSSPKLSQMFLVNSKQRFYVAVGLFSNRSEVTSKCGKHAIYLFFSINLLAFYHKCRALIGYATHYLFCDR